METFYDFVKRLVRSFEKVGVDYAFTGALAASFYGVPRTTVDVDVLVLVAEEVQKAKLVSALGEASLMVDEREIDKALKSGYRIATFRDSETPYSVDIIFSDKVFQRRTGRLAGLRAYFQTPEDLVLAKLRMIRATVPRERAQKDMEDVRAVLKFAAVDVEKVRRRAKEEGTLQIFEEIIRI